MNLNENFLQQQLNNLTEHKTIYIGLSGGIDSVVLLHLCAKIKDKYNFTAIHINHNLSNNANAWQQFCIELCQNLDIAIKTFNVTVATSNIEESARDKRLAIWHNLLETPGAVLLAHHMQDQAETVLYRLFRGAGVKGLSGIKNKTSCNKGFILRPLLDISKESIKSYAEKFNLVWCEDESNNNTNFDRNFIRKQVLPLIESRWHKAANNLSRTASICQDHSDFLEDTLDINFQNYSGTKANTLSIQKLLQASSFIRREIIRKFALTLGAKPLSNQQLELLEKEVMLARVDAQPLFKVGDYYFARYRDDLYLFNRNPYECGCDKAYSRTAAESCSTIKLEQNNCLCCCNLHIKWNLGTNLIINNVDYTGLLNFDRLSKFGELFDIKSVESSNKSVKKFFQQRSIPIWERCKYFIIFKNNCVVDAFKHMV